MNKNKNNKGDKILIIYQSISETSLILNLLKKYPLGKCVILVTGGKHFMPVLKKLKISTTFRAQIYSFHALSLKNPLNIFRMYFDVYFSEKSKKLSLENFKKAIFFSKYEDFLAPIFLSKKNIEKIYLIDNYKNIFSNKKDKPSFYKILKKFVIKILLINIDVKINFFSFKHSKKNSDSNQFPRYDLLKIKINKINPKKIKTLGNFRFKIDKKILKKKNILYIDSNDEDMVGNEFKDVTYRLFNFFLKKKYNIVIKRPTREKLSPCLESNSKFKYIYGPIPIELYDLNNFQFIFGFMTTALAKISEKNTKIKVCSIINLLSKKKNNKFKKVVHSFYKNLNSSKGKIYYPFTLKKLIKNN